MKQINVFLLLIVLSIFSTNMFAENLTELSTKQTLKTAKFNAAPERDSILAIKGNQTASPVIKPNKKAGSLKLTEVFSASPIIYTVLFIMSILSLVILLYTFITFRRKDLMSQSTIEDIKDYLLKENYEDALNYCENKKNLLSTMIASGIYTRAHGAQFMIETIKSEGKRATEGFWHRISILNDIVIIAPMLGLLGTVIGMFYAFYDINRSIDSLSALFDGLGVAVGTTVAGLVVAIIAMVFYTILKFKLVKSLSLVENEAVSLGNLIKTKV